MIHKRRTIIYPVLLLPSIELKLKVIDGILRWHFTCVIHSNRPCYPLCYIFLLFIFIFYGRHAIEVDIFLLSPIILLMSILMTLSIAVELPPLMLISNWFVCSLSYSPAYFMHEWLTRGHTVWINLSKWEIIEVNAMIPLFYGWTASGYIAAAAWTNDFWMNNCFAYQNKNSWECY